MMDFINTLLRTYNQGVIDQNFKGHYFEDKLPLYIAILVGVAIVSYLLGSLNFGVIISKLRGKDVRECGSGNAGATNMTRVYGKKIGILTFVGDALKAVLSCIIGIVLVGSLGGFVAGFFCVVGHAFPVYFKFKGGKGVACMAAVVLVTSPVCFLILLAIYIVLLLGFKMVSFASVMTVIIYPFLLSSTNGYGLQIIVALFCSILVVFLHRENIARIFHHEEPKISLGKKKQKQEIKVETDEDCQK
ncbi:MAG: glycerol-3-phosphate 1-O-acyltransferase PlsY [Clostridia bacterium]|nr:glycerol-3-phosphate 1-O-acyltransferase PlsY [Clostridia bacterium]